MTKEASSEQDLPLPPSHHAPPTPPPPPPKEEEEEEEDKQKRGRSSSVDSVDSVDSLGRIKRRRVRIGNGSDDDEDEDDDDLERRRGRRGRNGGVWRNLSRSRSRSRERRRTNERDDAVKGSLREDKKKEEEEEPEGGATMPLPPPSGVPDTRSAVKIFADAPPSEVALAPPPPRRRRRPDAKKPTTAATAITTDAIAAAAAPVPTPVPGSILYVPTAPVASTGTCIAAAISPSEQQQQELSSLSPKGGRSQRAPVSPTRGKRPPPPPAAAVLPLPTRPLPQEKREEEEEEEDDDLMFETEKEREEREMAERRARREKMLAQFGGADVTARGDEKDGSGGKSTKCPPPLVLSPAVPTCSLPTLVQEKKEKWHAGTATAAVPAMASATADTAAAAIAPPAGKKKTKETEKEKEEAMRIFLAETRRQVEDALGGAGELMMEDVEEDEEERNEGTDGADEVMKHEEEEEDEVEKEKGVGAATVAADTAAAAAAAAAGGGGAVELDIFSAEGALRTLLGWTAGWVHPPPSFPSCLLCFVCCGGHDTWTYLGRSGVRAEPACFVPGLRVPAFDTHLPYIFFSPHIVCKHLVSSIHPSIHSFIPPFLHDRHVSDRSDSIPSQGRRDPWRARRLRQSRAQRTEGCRGIPLTQGGGDSARTVQGTDAEREVVRDGVWEGGESVCVRDPSILIPILARCAHICACPSLDVVSLLEDSVLHRLLFSRVILFSYPREEEEHWLSGWIRVCETFVLFVLSKFISIRLVYHVFMHVLICLFDAFHAQVQVYQKLRILALSHTYILSRSWAPKAAESSAPSSSPKTNKPKPSFLSVHPAFLPSLTPPRQWPSRSCVGMS